MAWTTSAGRTGFVGRPNQFSGWGRSVWTGRPRSNAPPGCRPPRATCRASTTPFPRARSPEDKRLLVVTEGTAVIGLVDLVLASPGPDDAAVGLFLVHPDARGFGVGRAVADTLLTAARSLGIRRVTATVPPGWPPGERLLAALGFTLDPADAATRQFGNRNQGPRESVVVRAELRLAKDSH
ncbi:GNAT family N-acetyltransferase [Streptomyces sp. G-G2]|uniref:GNAT family N-acetyltransferase n=1 Tax=Streptomyces sp. G-G2 TaxID=3046201 RepID=UPI0024BA4C53|nr:GNAT family N-acetyltransferase [Streptomyces sp. G-G2]MDJ0385815.1 GNAT family N-acetyltransferase [Streptomyces sp. G-G2]